MKSIAYKGVKIMKTAKIIASLGVLAMTLVLLNGFINGDFFEDGSIILNNPWGIVSIVDLYVGFILFAMWIIVRESSRFKAVLWIAALMILGFFTGALYIWVKLRESNSIEEVLLGKHRLKK